MPRTPSNQTAGKIDPIMLLAMWAIQLQREKNLDPNIFQKWQAIIIAGIGKPSFPISESLTKEMIKYWNRIDTESCNARHLVSDGDKITIGERNIIAEKNAVIGYDDPQGVLEAREKAAKALSLWYQLPIKPENILFTLGGAGGLSNIARMLNGLYPNGYIVTPLPFYSLYANAGGHQNNLFPFSVMEKKGYRLTAELLQNALNKAQQKANAQGRKVSAVLLCDPNNPLGTVIKPKELKKIAQVLKNFDGLIILDEVYAEMVWDEGVSLLAVAPELKEKIIVMRSATKALSAAGERMSVTIAFDEHIMSKLLQENIASCGHAPISEQLAYAEALCKLDGKELTKLKSFYKPQVDLVMRRLNEMGANLPDPDYSCDGAFYVVGDFSDLLGLELPSSTERALAKAGMTTTDEDVAYYLLFKDRVMVAPLSYFGLSSNLGYLRITCSSGDDQLNKLMDRLEKRLTQARHDIHQHIVIRIRKIIQQIVNIDQTYANQLSINYSRLQLTAGIREINAKDLKIKNQSLKKLLTDAKIFLAKNDKAKFEKEVIKIQTYWRMKRAQSEKKGLQTKVDKKWAEWVNYNYPLPELKQMFFQLSNSQRMQIRGFREFLNDESNPTKKKFELENYGIA